MSKMYQEVIIEVERNERTYRFIMPLGAPCGEAYDACCDALQELVKISNDIAENAKRKKDNPSPEAEKVM